VDRHHVAARGNLIALAFGQDLLVKVAISAGDLDKTRKIGVLDAVNSLYRTRRRHALQFHNFSER